MDFFEDTWCDLDWTPWIRFNSPQTQWRRLPRGQGVYRVRPVGTNFLIYVGQTGRSLRQRISSLRRQAFAELMPYDDPHTAAPNLWVWNKERNWLYECSAAPTNHSRKKRLALECYLLWQYRLEKGESTLCNFGRFHPDYIKSKVRTTGFRGRKLLEHEDRNPAGTNSQPPLQLRGKPFEQHWMGLDWSQVELLNANNLRNTPKTPGLYKIVNLTTRNLRYIGQTKNIANRLRSHSRKFRQYKETGFSFTRISNPLRDHELKEMENDLLGAYYRQTKTPPENQFGSS